MHKGISTASGEEWNFDRDEQDCVQLDDIAHALGNICRFTGHCRRFYSVALHSILVWWLVTRVYGRADYGAEAIAHDWTEAFVGDMSSPLKSTQPTYKQTEQRVERELRCWFPMLREIPSKVKMCDWIAYCIEREYLMPAKARQMDEADGLATYGLNSEPWWFKPAVILCSFFPKLASWQLKRIAINEGMLYDI